MSPTCAILDIFLISLSPYYIITIYTPNLFNFTQENISTKKMSYRDNILLSIIIDGT